MLPVSRGNLVDRRTRSKEGISRSRTCDFTESSGPKGASRPSTRLQVESSTRACTFSRLRLFDAQTGDVIKRGASLSFSRGAWCDERTFARDVGVFFFRISFGSTPFSCGVVSSRAAWSARRFCGRTHILVLSLLLAPAVVHAHSSRPGGCDASAGHGTSSSTGDGGYTLTHTSGTLAPGERVTVTLAKPSSGADFKGSSCTPRAVRSSPAPTRASRTAAEAGTPWDTRPAPVNRPRRRTSPSRTPPAPSPSG